MKVLLTTLNSKYIHKALALRWLYVARSEFDARIQEFTINDSIDKIVEKMKPENYDVICFAVYIWNVNETKELIFHLKEKYPDLRIVLGGPEVTYENNDWFDCPIEAIVIGEGEKALWDYLRDGNTESVKVKKNQKCRVARVDISYLESLQDPYFLDFDEKEMYSRYLYIETSRGCPYGCAYCLSSTDRLVRKFSEEYLNRVYEKMSHIRIRQVKFLDRTFNLDYKHALFTLKKLENIQTVDSFQMELVVETLPEEILSYMEKEMDKKRFRFEVGVQSFNTDALCEVGRNSNLDKLKENISRLKKAGVILHTDLIAGLPKEDKTSFEDSYNQLFALHADELQCGILKLLRGTSLREKADEYGIIYNENSPYEILYNTLLSQKDMEIINYVALGTEKAYNNHRLQITIDDLVENYSISAFEINEKLGKMISTLPHPYQLDEYFLKAEEVLRVYCEKEYLKGLLARDYYKDTKTKPINIFPYENKTAMELILNDSRFTEDDIYHYGVLTPYSENKRKMAQLVLYFRNGQNCRRYRIDMDTKEICRL